MKRMVLGAAGWAALALGEEALRHAALIEHLDGACVKTPRACAGELLARAPFDDRFVCDFDSGVLHVVPRDGSAADKPFID
jgi:hypothetical protein